MLFPKLLCIGWWVSSRESVLCSELLAADPLQALHTPVPQVQICRKNNVALKLVFCWLGSPCWRSVWQQESCTLSWLSGRENLSK